MAVENDRAVRFALVQVAEEPFRVPRVFALAGCALRLANASAALPCAPLWPPAARAAAFAAPAPVVELSLAPEGWPPAAALAGRVALAVAVKTFSYRSLFFSRDCPFKVERPAGK